MGIYNAPTYFQNYLVEKGFLYGKKVVFLLPFPLYKVSSWEYLEFHLLQFKRRQPNLTLPTKRPQPGY